MPNKGEDQYLSADVLEADSTGEVFVRNCAHDAGHIVDHRKGDQRIQKAVRTAEEPPKETSESGKGKLNASPDLFHNEPPLSFIYPRFPRAVEP